MTTTNAIKKLAKYGEVQKSGRMHWVHNAKDVVSFLDIDGIVSCINVRGEHDVSDLMSDYHAGVYCDNISQAIRVAGWA